MQFTYNLASTDPTELAIAKVRLEIGDTTPNAGVKPNGDNFSDSELSIWLSEEDTDVMQTTARACETLSRMWANVANITVGPRQEALGKVSKDWSDRASEIRGQYDRTVKFVRIARV